MSNVLCLYYNKKELLNTPSFQNGISPGVEAKYRREGVRFIITAGQGLKLPYDTIATGVVFFHRFYMFHSFKSFPHYVTASCCLFLAGKAEETPKRCRDIVDFARSTLTDEEYLQFGEYPKDEVMTLEKILLQTIKFNLNVEHPYAYLLKYATRLKGDKQKLNMMVNTAWRKINDSLYTTLSLQWEPEIVAIACMYLASKLTNFEVKDWHGRKKTHKKWWDMFVELITENLLEDICHQVLDVSEGSNKLSLTSITPLSQTAIVPTPNPRPTPRQAERSHTPPNPCISAQMGNLKMQQQANKWKPNCPPQPPLPVEIAKPPPPPLPEDTVSYTSIPPTPLQSYMFPPAAVNNYTQHMPSATGVQGPPPYLRYPPPVSMQPSSEYNQYYQGTFNNAGYANYYQQPYYCLPPPPVGYAMPGMEMYQTPYQQPEHPPGENTSSPRNRLWNQPNPNHNYHIPKS